MFRLYKHVNNSLTIETSPSMLFKDWTALVSYLASVDPHAELYFQSTIIKLWWSTATNDCYTAIEVN